MKIIAMGWTVTPPDIVSLVGRFLDSEMTLREFRDGFPFSPWSPEHDKLANIESIRLMLAEDNYAPGFTDDEARDRLRELLADSGCQRDRRLR
jgi:hypothetical protein